MMGPDDFRDPAALREFVAQQIVQRRLAVVLGAGVSKDYGLPEWSELLKRMYKGIGSSPPSGLSDEDAAERLQMDHFRGDRAAFADAVHHALYGDVPSDVSRFIGSGPLGAITALTIALSRHAQAKVITFNFDDILERYLRLHGMRVAVVTAPEFAPQGDVAVYHPHGYLPMNNVNAEPRLVLARLDFDRVIGRAENRWRTKLVQVMREHYCLFIGLSGRDFNLTSMLTEIAEHHPAGALHHPWGFRVCVPGDDRTAFFEERRVVPLEVASYEALPRELYELCELATRENG